MVGVFIGLEMRTTTNTTPPTIPSTTSKTSTSPLPPVLVEDGPYGGEGGSPWSDEQDAQNGHVTAIELRSNDEWIIAIRAR